MEAQPNISSAAFVQHERSILEYIITVSPIALMLYDYVLTISQEINVIWLKPWSYGKILFFLVRYLPFAALYILLADQVLPNTSVAMCSKTFPALAWLVDWGILLSEAALMVRTWAVWQRNRYLGVGLAILWIGAVITLCVINVRVGESLVVSPDPQNRFPGCYVITESPVDTRVDFAVLSGMEMVVMALMVISAYRAYKWGSMSKFTHVIHRDGILYYFYLLVLTIMNLVLSFTLPSKFGQDSLVTFQWMFYSVLTSRIMINTRVVAYNGAESTIDNPTSIVFDMGSQQSARQGTTRQTCEVMNVSDDDRHGSEEV